ncbi:hypothetical protein SS1G_12428 [Sclerotinia sclerotiorum 1980 UF-70]|uniref:ceramidase n=1 Tax=Sclerotinia sclerotiorum (strain ATCC 18683 / 1980 / Ss-1) TaxID=665079 RepID=A7F4A4_SCLS1|nr:hypothetical protein SS1G_12428 [Sclerotinia sclerotiorum 1980 UF-70]EDN97575.1 hypothetical protein SS1G_12428 [Sclerotinia sclerotiorum 1980 UF-70]
MYSRGEIPTYTIDLSLPPSKRYEKIAVDFKEQLCGLPKELDETLRHWHENFILIFLFKVFAFLFIRRLYSAEEMEEVKGIAKISGINVRFLVALNVMLDSLMCCTSGGVLVNTDNDVEDQSMMHLRLLDWDLDGLRDLLLVLEYVNSNSSTPTRVIARSITYAGYVGILTGVSTLVMGKDQHRSYVRSSPSFIVQTNHDVFLWQARNRLADHDGYPFPVPQPNPYPAPPPGSAYGDPAVYEKYHQYWGHKDSIDRYNSLRENWMAIPEGIGTKRSAEIEEVKSWMWSEPVEEYGSSNCGPPYPGVVSEVK